MTSENVFAPGGPLAGVTVLDLTSYLAGPYGCALLTDLGADVIKVEAPEGDMLRRYPSTLERESRAFVGANRGKRSIVINLKDEAGRDLLYRLVERADVLVQNFRPSVPARLKIDYATLKERNPRLIYFALTGYGDSGPLCDQPGFDQVLQTMTGIASFQGAATGSPPQVVVGSIVDYYASALTALGITAALHHRARTGEGQYVSTSLLRTALTMQACRFVWTHGEPREVNRELTPGRTAGIHPTKAGYLYISAHTERFWQALCEILELPDLAHDRRYDTMRKRANRADELLPRIHAALARRTALEWEALMAGRVPSAAARQIEDLFDHPQVLAEGLVETLEHPTIGKYRTITRPLQFGATPGGGAKGAPALGQHTESVLIEHGVPPDDIAELRRRGAIG